MNADKQTQQEWIDNPKNYFLGIFYFNPKDKRIFPPKRIAFLGWTVNFANPLSIGALILLVIAVYAVIYLLK